MTEASTEQIRLLVEAFVAAGAQDGVSYLSVPITSGRREFKLMLDVGSNDLTDVKRHHEWRDLVLRENELEAESYAVRARELFPYEVVINPAAISVPGWTQADYGTLWDTVVAQFAHRVIASPGWAFSRGARREVDLALRIGVPIADLAGNLLSKEQVEIQDESARTELTNAGMARDVVDRLLPPMAALSQGRLIALPVASSGFQETAKAEWAASEVFAWLRGERKYQIAKFGYSQDDEHTREGLSDDGWWWKQLTSYFHRSRVLGLEPPGGRQALAKFVATACGLLESAVRLYGPLPLPGVPSGENLDTVKGASGQDQGAAGGREQRNTG